MKLLLGLATLPFMAVVAIAGQPALLTNAQMDKVTAGQQTITIVQDSFGEILGGTISAGHTSLPTQTISIPPFTTTVTSTLP
jgi:hypothetical protein